MRRRHPVDFEAVFGHFAALLQQIYRHENIGEIRLMEMYEDVYQLCCMQGGEDYTELLFKGIVTFLGKFTDEVCRELLPGPLVPAYAAAWRRYATASLIVDNTCAYLNREMEWRWASRAEAAWPAGPQKARNPYVDPHLNHGAADAPAAAKGPRPGGCSIVALAHVFWKDRVVLELHVNHDNRLVRELLEQLADIRRSPGAPVNTDAIRTCVDSLIEVESHDASMRLYRSEFEASLLAASEAHFQREAASAIADGTIPDFMRRAQSRLAAEREMAKQCLPAATAPLMLQLFEQCWIGAHREPLTRAFPAFLENGSDAAAAACYDLLRRVQGTAPVVDALRAHVCTAGERLLTVQIVPTFESARDYVEPLLELHASSLALCARVFPQSAECKAAVDQAFRHLLNSTAFTLEIARAHAPELLARYCDQLLRKAPAGAVLLDERATERQLAAALELFQFLDAKDAFQHLYGCLLAKRLIGQLSSSQDLEMTTVARLRAATGVSFVHKLHRMFADMAVSRDLQAQLKADGGSRAAHALVLTQGVWPLKVQQYGPSGLGKLPPECLAALGAFETVYNRAHSGRKLTWLHQLCRVDVRLVCFDRPYEMQLSVPQYAVFRAVADSEPGVALAAIAEQLDLTLAQAASAASPMVEIGLLQVCDPVSGVPLALSGASRERRGGALLIVTGDHVIVVSSTFSSRRPRFKLAPLFGAPRRSVLTVGGATMKNVAPSGALAREKPMAAPSNSADDLDAQLAQQEIAEDRSHFVQAAIVRVLKASRTCTYTHLVERILEQCRQRFLPSVSLIKRCTELLMEKGFIKRSPDDRELYVYVA